MKNHSWGWGTIIYTLIMWTFLISSCTHDKILEFEAFEKKSLLPDVVNLGSNPYTQESFAHTLTSYGKDSILVECVIADTGSVCLKVPRYYLPDFNKITVLSLSTGHSIVYYKSFYDFSTDCLDPLRCTFLCQTTSDTMTINPFEIDKYFNPLYTFEGEGDYAARFEQNANNEVAEITHKNNVQYLAIHYRNNFGVWTIQKDSTLLSNNLKNFLDRI